MKKPYSDKRWNDIPLGKIVSNNNPSDEEIKKLKKKADEMKKRIENKNTSTK